MVQLQNQTTKNGTSGMEMVTMLPLAIPDAKISVVGVFTVLWLNDASYSKCLKQ